MYFGNKQIQEQFNKEFMKNTWAIIDLDSMIHSGSEEEMRKAFFCMQNAHADIMDNYSITVEQAKDLKDKYDIPWNGDLLLIEIHEHYR